jgi:sulfur relay (sulfurtransferase) complex TusBCD TusD component (DsrE family)
MTDTLVILNDPPYGTERSFNGLRLATWLARRNGVEVRVFLMGDATACAKQGQKVPKGFYNIENMLARVQRGVARSAYAAPAWTLEALPTQSSQRDVIAAAWTS